jgi:hypothetical protein
LDFGNEVRRRTVGFRVIAANQVPDHATLARFRVRPQDALAGLFGQVLGLCARAGLVSVGVIALDGTKLHANASTRANRTYAQIAAEILAEADAVDAAEEERLGERRGDELPGELADPCSRRARLREAKRQLEAEHEAAQRAHREHLRQRQAREHAAGRTLTGRKPTAPPERVAPQTRCNITDPDSRLVKTARGFIQGYTAQAVTTAEQIIIAADVLIGGVDQGQLEPMIRAAISELEAAGVQQPAAVALADGGYWSSPQIQALWADGIQALVPPDAANGKHKRTGKRRRTGGIYEHMRRVFVLRLTSFPKSKDFSRRVV